MSPRPIKNTTRVAIWLDPCDVADLKAMADAKGISLSAFIRMIIIEYLGIHS